MQIQNQNQNQIQVANNKTSFGLVPKTFDEAVRFAQIICQSNLLPRDYQNNVGNILCAIQYGTEIGLSPFQAMQSLAVINGRPSLYGDALLALVRSSGLLEYIQEEVLEDKAVCKVKRKNEPETIREFSKDDAKKAGLLNKSGPWSLYPKRMLQMRARAFALRDTFADILRGVGSAEELNDVEYTITDITPQQTQTQSQESQVEVIQTLKQLDNKKFISFLPKYFKYFNDKENQDKDNKVDELLNKISTKWEISNQQKEIITTLSTLDKEPEDYAEWFNQQNKE